MATKLYCTQCGREMGKTPECPHCHAESDYWDVVPPHLSGFHDHEEKGETRDLPTAVASRDAPTVGPGAAAECPPTQDRSSAETWVSWLDRPEEEERKKDEPSGPASPPSPVLVSGSEPATLDLVQNQPAPDDWQTLPLGPGADSPRPAVAELVRLTAPGEGSTYPLYAGDNQIGTKGAQDVRLDDQTISNPHALIICHDRESREPARIIDLKSRNGTFVGGERVSRAELNEDCLIRLADIEFRFRRLG